MIRSLLLLSLAAVASTAGAQLGSPFAPTDAIDTLAGAPTGDASAFGGAVDRARGVANTANASPFGADPAAGGSPFGADASGGFGDPAASPFGAGAPSPFGAAAGFGAAALPIPLNPVGEATLSAWGGTRIVCRRTGQVLEDGREINILVSQVGSYYDDGKQGNDSQAGDNIYTNIVIDRNFISPEAHLVKTRMIQTLQYASQLTPMQFNLAQVATTENTPTRNTGWRVSRNGLEGLNVELVSTGVLQVGSVDAAEGDQATLEAVGPNLVRFKAERGTFGKPTRIDFGQTALVLDGGEVSHYARVTRISAEPLSGRLAIFPLQPVPKMVDLETEQDKKLMEWVDRRLRDYRTEPDNLQSTFYKAYMPTPPRAPNIPLPANFTNLPLPEGFVPPTQTAAGGGGQGFVGDGGDAGVTGEPIGAASSRYF